MRKKEIAIVVSAFNEEKYIGKLLKRLYDKSLSPVYVVDDGSTDETPIIARGYGVRLICHGVNRGKGAAMRRGATEAFREGARAVIFMDGDGQHLVEDLENFYKVLSQNNYDVVFGSRNHGQGVPIVRYLGNKAGSVIVNIVFGIYVSDLICGFRAISRKAFLVMNWESNGYSVETEMVILTKRNKLSYVEVPVEAVYHNTSKGVNLFDALKVFWDVVKWKLRQVLG